MSLSDKLQTPSDVFQISNEMQHSTVEDQTLVRLVVYLFLYSRIIDAVVIEQTPKGC